MRLVEAFESTLGHEGGPRGDNDAPFSTANRGWGMPCLILEYGDSSLGEFIGRGLLPPTERKACDTPCHAASPIMPRTPFPRYTSSQGRLRGCDHMCDGGSNPT